MKRFIVYIIAAVIPVLFMGSTLTFSPFSFLDGAGSQPDAESTFRDNIEKEFNIGKGKLLTVDLKTGGALEIKGWNKNSVRVKAILDGADAEDINLEIKETSSGLSILTDHMDYNNNTDIKFVIDVPDEFDLELETMGGEIVLNNIKGEFNGQTMGGDLGLSGLKGEINLSTMGGDIKLVDSDIDGKVHTMGGKVTIENVKGDVKGTSMGGNVSLKNVTRRNGESTKNQVLISSMGGNIDVDNAPAGAEVKTIGGDIEIISAEKFVRAKTMGGDITIKSVDGEVKAVTMGGDVNVNLKGGNDGDKDVQLTSMGGDIYLTVPPDFSMDIDISLAFTKNHAGDFKIVSDFDLKQEMTNKWENEKGSPRKYIYGTGTTGDGKHKVKIETINGNVFLKRG